jgi:hypothetical protein
MLHWWNHQSVGCLIKSIPGAARRALGSLLGRGDVQRNSEELDRAAALLKQLPCPAMPSQLPFLIRQRIRKERIQASKVTLAWRLQNQFAHLAVPAAAGLLCAIFIFGTFIRLFETPVHANSASAQDVPLPLRTSPRLRSGTIIANNGIDCMVVSILIDPNGRVADFHVIKGRQTPEQMRYLESLLLFAQFDPATLFGKPTTDTLTLKLRGGQVRSLAS